LISGAYFAAMVQQELNEETFKKKGYHRPEGI
jgi:hypothetical protein